MLKNEILRIKLEQKQIVLGYAFTRGASCQVSIFVIGQTTKYSSAQHPQNYQDYYSKELLHPQPDSQTVRHSDSQTNSHNGQGEAFVLSFFWISSPLTNMSATI